jgi:hypothetical protein
LKTQNLLLIGAAGLAGWFFLRKTQLASRTKLLFRRLRLVGKGLSKQLELNFAVQNPTNATANVSALTGEVIVNNQIVADFSSFGLQKIAPKSQSDLKVVASPSSGIISLLTQKGWLTGGVFYTIRGTANIDGIVAPFEYSAKLG